MSIASEYEKIAQLSLYYPQRWTVPASEITRSGGLKMLRTEFDRQEALALAAWIVDTFSEKDREDK